METSGIVARGPELGALERALDRERLPAAVLLEGEPGIGKTTLWTAAVELCRARGDRVLACRPAEVEVGLAYGALGDLVGDAVRDAELPPPQRRALEVALLRADPDGPPPDRLAVGRAVETLLAGLAETGLAVAVDDAQWLDAASAAALAFALRRLGGPTAVVVARRAAADEPVPLGLDRALPVTRVEVGPLSLGATHELLRTRLGSLLPRPVLRRVHEASGGNPFFALELARLVGADADPGAPLALPGSLRALLRRRLQRLPPATLDALLAVALLRRATPARVGAALGAEAELEPAVAAGVVAVDDEIAFTHPLLAAAVVDAVSGARRRELHARLAALAPDDESRARHLALAGASDAGAFERGASAAAARGAPDAAAELLEAAARASAAPDPEWSRRLTEAAERWEEAGDFERASRLLHEVVARAPAGRERAAALTQLAVLNPGATDLAERARAEAGDDDALLARIAFVGAGNLGFAGDLRAGLAESATAVSHAERAGDAKLLALSLTRLAFFTAATAAGDPEPLLARAARLERETAGVPVYWEARGTRASCALWADELDTARTLLLEQLAATTRNGDESSRLGVLWNLADLESRTGDVAAAASYAAEGAAIADGTGDVQSRAALLHPTVLVLGLEGRFDEARGASDRALAELAEIEDAYFPLHHAYARGAVELAAGDARAALARLEPLERDLARVGVADPGVVPYAGELLEALVRCGRGDEAILRLAPLEETGRPRLLGIAARIRGALGGSTAELERAVALHRTIPHRIELGRTLLALGRQQRRERALRAARTTLTEAEALLAACGAAAWAAQARAELARLPGRSAADGLTPAEQRVAALVAAGRTNREVAEELVVTLRTVETHLSRVYAKLGVRSRTELARLAGERSWIPTTREGTPAA